MQRVVLAFSGSFDSSRALTRLVDEFDAEVATVTVDIGQDRGLEDVRDRALALGAVRAHVVDAREEFAHDFVLPALAGRASAATGDPHAGFLAHALIARRLVDLARLEDATAVAHAECDGLSPDRFDRLIHALDPALRVVAPLRERSSGTVSPAGPSRKHDREPPSSGAAGAGAANLWGRAVPPDGTGRTRIRNAVPGLSARVAVEFTSGVPVAVNGVPMPLVDLISILDVIGAAHGVGLVGAGGSGRTWDAPAAVVLTAAHTELQRRVLGADLRHRAAEVGAAYAGLLESGAWYTPARDALDAFVSRIQQDMTGVVCLEVGNGDCHLDLAPASGSAAVELPSSRPPPASRPRASGESRWDTGGAGVSVPAAVAAP